MAHRKKHKSFLDGLGELGLATGDKICRYNVRVFGKGRKPVVKPGVTCFTIRERGLTRAKKATEGRGASAFITASDTKEARAARKASRAATRAAAKATRTAERTRTKAAKKASRKAVSEARVATRRSKSRSASRAGTARDEYGNPIRRRKSSR